MKRIGVFVIIIIVFGLFSYLYFEEGTLPVDKRDTSSKIFVVPKGAGLSYISNQLVSDGLIRNKIVFYLIVKKEGYDKIIQAGDFRLSPSMSAYKIAKSLTHGTLDTWVTIIEGMRREEIAQLLSENLNIPETEFLKYATEGTLFPDTYLFPRDATAGAIIDIFKANFNKKYSSVLQNKARQQLLTDDEVVILASIVEREARFADDRKQVASILVKRLKNNWPLDVDASIQYAVGYQSSEKTWWKNGLTVDDLKINSPYNSYKNKGLPPTPISNPGLSSIESVVSANVNTPNWFYVSDSSGRLHFAPTIEEHNSNVQKFVK